MSEKIYTVHEVAKMEDKKYRTVLKWIRQGKLGATKCGKTILITEKDLILFRANKLLEGD